MLAKPEEHPVILERLLGNKSFVDDLRVFLSLTVEQANQIAQFVEAEGGFGLGIDARQNLMAMGMEPVNLSRTLVMAEFLYDYARKARVTARQVVDELSRCADSLRLSDFGSKSDSFLGLFAEKPAYDAKALAREVRQVGVPECKMVEAAVDIRAVYDPKARKLLGYLPISVVKVQVIDPEEGLKAFSFSLDASALSQLEESIKAIREILAKVQREIGDTVVLLEH